MSAALEVHLSPEQGDELAERIAERLREPEEDRWLTTREAAEYLGIHPVTLRRLAAERRVPFIQELRRLRPSLPPFRPRRSAPGG